MERERERIIPTYFLKVQLDHSVKRACCTFPPTFWNSKSESSKSLSVCIINATRVKEAAVSTLRIQIFTWQHGQQKHMDSGHRYVSERVWLTVYMVLKNTLKLCLFYFEGSDASLHLNIFTEGEVAVLKPLSFSSRAEDLCVYYYSVEVGAPARRHLWLISEQFFKLPVKWICIAFAVNPFARQNDNEEKVL